MKLSIKANLALAAFLAVCLVPSAGMLLLPEWEAAANQALAPPPRSSGRTAASTPRCWTRSPTMWPTTLPSGRR